MNSISGVMMPWRAYQSCVTALTGAGAQAVAVRELKIDQIARDLSDVAVDVAVSFAAPACFSER